MSIIRSTLFGILFSLSLISIGIMFLFLDPFVLREVFFRVIGILIVVFSMIAIFLIKRRLEGQFLNLLLAGTLIFGFPGIDHFLFPAIFLMFVGIILLLQAFFLRVTKFLFVLSATSAGLLISIALDVTAKYTIKIIGLDFIGLGVFISLLYCTNMFWKTKLKCGLGFINHVDLSEVEDYEEN